MSKGLLADAVKKSAGFYCERSTQLTWQLSSKEAREREVSVLGLVQCCSVPNSFGSHTAKWLDGFHLEH